MAIETAKYAQRGSDGNRDRDPLAPRGHRALRRHRTSIEGGLYLVTTGTRDRIPIFLDRDIARSASSVLGEARLWRDSAPCCWVLMPDHFHALLRLGASESLAELMKRVKSVTAQTANRCRGKPGSIWAPAFHDRALREEDDAIDVARYVLANPVRAGIVQDVASYPFRGGMWRNL